LIELQLVSCLFCFISLCLIFFTRADTIICYSAAVPACWYLNNSVIIFINLNSHWLCGSAQLIVRVYF
jgi:hypothetical protein